MRRILIAIAATALFAGTAVAQTAVTTTTETFVRTFALARWLLLA